MPDKKRDEKGRIIVPREKYIELQIEEMLGSDNAHFTRENRNLLRRPTIDEEIENYIDHGGADNFAKRYVPDDVPDLRNG